jgi:hypothetical protein
MKLEIIYTEHYALILGDEQTKENDWGYIRFQGGDVKLIGKYFADDWLKVIAHRPLTNAPILEGVHLLPEFGKEDDVKKEAKDYADNSATCDYEEGINVGKYQRFLEGYNKAKETYIEILKAIESLCDNQNPTHEEIWRLCYSAQQPKRPEYFETVCDCQECGANKTNLSLDMGCENKMAKTTNSQGQTELVGEYSYE